MLIADALLVLALSPLIGPEPVAETVVLKDGTVLRGLVTATDPRAGTTLVVRREWVQEHAPDFLARWDADAAPRQQRAVEQRRTRLRAWRRERAAAAEAGDRVLAAIDRALARLDDGAEAAETPLIAVTISPRDLRRVDRQPARSVRLLRQAWRAEFADPEAMTLPELEAALMGRGFDLANTDPVPLADRLPLPVESDARWRARRAATEVRSEPGLRFVQSGNLFLPEPDAGGIPMIFQAGGFGNFNADGPGNPGVDGREAALRGIAARGRTGAIVRRQRVASNPDAATVEYELMVRQPNGRWTPFGTAASTIRPADLTPADRQAPGGFQMQMSSFSFEFGPNGAVSREERTPPDLGPMLQKATTRARARFDAELEGLALPLD